MNLNLAAGTPDGDRRVDLGPALRGQVLVEVHFRAAFFLAAGFFAFAEEIAKVERRIAVPVAPMVSSSPVPETATPPAPETATPPNPDTATPPLPEKTDL